jgi:hypothetical protein
VKKICLSFYIILSIILQIGGLGSIAGGITEAAVTASDDENKDLRSGKFKLWYQ